MARTDGSSVAGLFGFAVSVSSATRAATKPSERFPSVVAARRMQVHALCRFAARKGNISSLDLRVF
jgi:hypothetical protein